MRLRGQLETATMIRHALASSSDQLGLYVDDQKGIFLTPLSWFFYSRSLGPPRPTSPDRSGIIYRVPRHATLRLLEDQTL